MVDGGGAPAALEAGEGLGDFSEGRHLERVGRLGGEEVESLGVVAVRLVVRHK